MNNIDAEKLWERITKEHYRIGAEEALTLATTMPKEDLYALANRLREHFLGNRIETCSIQNARSGRCTEDCKWCAQSAHHSASIDCYELIGKQEALDHASSCASLGVNRYSLVTSGRTLSNDDTNRLADTYNTLKNEIKIELCGSLGLLNRSQLEKLYTAGMRRYHCNLETAPSYFGQLCTTHTTEEKLQTIEWAREVGMDICSGGIIGMGENLEQRIELAIALRDANAVSIPMNILQPIPGTPLENQKPLTDEEILTAFALFRIINPTAHIRFAGGRSQITHIQQKALKCGVSAALVGDLLTTIGSSVSDDFNMFHQMGYSTKQ